MQTTSQVISQLAGNTDEWRSERRTLWFHITLINATVLGFSVATTQIRGLVVPNYFLLFSWLLLLLSVLLGIMLLQVDQDSKVSGDIKSFELNYNLSEITELVNTGKIKESEKLGYILATYYTYGINTLLKKEGNRLSTYAMDIINKYKDKLPSKKIFKDIEKPNGNWLHKNLIKAIRMLRDNYIRLGSWHFFLTTLAYISMFISILTGPYTQELFSPLI